MTRLLLCVICVGVVAQPAGRGVISGVVMEASSGDPVRKAIVTATWHGTPRAWATTRTDGSGKFVFEGLPAGKYDLRATKQGFGSAIYGANSLRELGDLITLADGETHGDIKLRFLHPGSIAGRVLDPDGDPVANAQVALLRPARNLGERILANSQMTSTNDRGEYKFNTVDPGEYYVHCSPNIQRPMGILPQDIAAPQYFGGAYDSKDASPLSLHGGDILSGIDFHLLAQHPAKVTGHISGVPPQDPPSDNTQRLIDGQRAFRGGGDLVSVNLIAADDGGMFGGGGGAAAAAPDYNFDMANVIPGRYRIVANIRAKEKNYYASQQIDIHEGANDVALSMELGVAVKGHLKIEGPIKHSPEDFRVLLNPPAGQRMANYSAQVKKDGSFTMSDVPPGEWIMILNPAIAGLFDKSVMLGDQDVLYRHIPITSGSDAPLNIVVSSNNGAVSGEVDSGGSDPKQAGILLEPVGKWHTLVRFYHSATAGDDGKFKLPSVAPGKYKIFALEKIATLSYRNPESAELLDALGEEIEVAEGRKIEVHPRLIPQEKAKEILKP